MSTATVKHAQALIHTNSITAELLSNPISTTVFSQNTSDSCACASDSAQRRRYDACVTGVGGADEMEERRKGGREGGREETQGASGRKIEKETKRESVGCACVLMYSAFACAGWWHKCIHTVSGQQPT